MKSIYIAVLLLLACVCYTQGFLVAKKNGTATKEKATKPPKKEKCLIVKGKGKNLIGDVIHIHKDFAPTLKKIDDVAKQCLVKLSVKGSYEQTPDPAKATKLTAVNAGKSIKFVVMDPTGKKLVCNNICLAKEGEKIPEVKCLVTNFRRENLRYAPHGEVGSVDDASDAKPGFLEIARGVQVACKGAKL